MLKDRLKGMSQANFVEYGYGQVEPNHLSAQRTAQIYAQLPANAEIEVLEQGQFVKYDYLNGEVNFTVQANGCLFTMKLNFTENISLMLNLQWLKITMLQEYTAQ